MSEQPDTRLEEGRDEHSVPAREQGLRRFWNSRTRYRRAPPSKSYPPVSSIPKTSPERLALASAENPSSADAKTILYLAYGSNLCAQTFLGFRGIRPISQINVSAPVFELCFDLPGIPYNEPCFANTRPRKIPELPIPGDPPKFPPPPYGAFPARNRPTWSKGVYGVVYEVTPEDYATIIKTEGGGQGYHDVLTPCFELPPALHIPEKPPIPGLPKPFLAHTLYAPTLPDLPGDGDNPGKEESDDGDDGDKDPRKQPWFRRLLLPSRRPNPDYAQASARYLNLIRDGAREHALPDDYQAYLAQLQSYAITSVSQQIGRVLFIVTALPGLLLIFGLGRLLADKAGRTPRWLGVATNAMMNILWAVYDVVFKPLFGDGERKTEDLDMRRRAKVVIITDEAEAKKNRLLGDW